MLEGPVPPSITGPGRAVFDICDTLYRENTTFGFLRHWHERRGSGVAYARLERALLARWLPFRWLHAAAWRAFGLDMIRTLALRTLRGAEDAALRAAAESYVRDRLPPLANAPLHARLAAHAALGHPVLLASASLDVVVREIARTLEADWVASELEMRNGRCTGRLRRDLTGGKLAAIKAALADGQPVYAYSDNRTDRGLLQAVDHAFVVIPEGRSRSGWKGMRASFIDL